MLAMVGATGSQGLYCSYARTFNGGKIRVSLLIGETVTAVKTGAQSKDRGGGPKKQGACLRASTTWSYDASIA